MNPLKNLIPLKSKITVYVPSTMDVDKEIDNTAYVDKVARLLSESFGGATASPCNGYWVSDSGALVKEKTVAVYAYCTTEQAEEYMDSIVEMCYSLKQEMGQEAVALEYNGGMYFI